MSMGARGLLQDNKIKITWISKSLSWARGYVSRPRKKKGGGNHYARVAEITKGLFGEDIVIIYIPVLGVEKVVNPTYLIK